MAKKTSRFVFDWWVVQKRIVYLIVAILLASGLAAGAALYVWKYGNPLANVGDGMKLAAGARFVSFEGDVRVIRAATREKERTMSSKRLRPRVRLVNRPAPASA
jgi:hypothetical protein